MYTDNSTMSILIVRKIKRGKINMEAAGRECTKPKSRLLKVGYNMYTSTIAWGETFQPESGMMRHNEFVDKVVQHWTETVEDGQQGMKRAEF